MNNFNEYVKAVANEIIQKETVFNKKCCELYLRLKYRGINGITTAVSLGSIVAGLGLGGIGGLPYGGSNGNMLNSNLLQVAGGSIIKHFTGNVPHYTTEPTSANLQHISSNTPYIIRNTLNYTYQGGFDNYSHLYGRPLLEYRNLGDIRGFTVIANIIFDDIGDILIEERNEIETLLTSGVIF